MFFAAEAHFRADAELRGKWTLKGEPGVGGVHQSQVRREGQLLLGGMSGDGREPALAKTGEATGNLCLGRRAVVQDRVGRFLAGLSHRKAEVRRRCRTVLQSRTEAFRLGLPAKCTSHRGFSLETRTGNPRLSLSRRFLNVDYRCNSWFLKRIACTTMPYKTGIRLLGVARNPANGFPARLLNQSQGGMVHFEGR